MRASLLKSHKRGICLRSYWYRMTKMLLLEFKNLSRRLDIILITILHHAHTITLHFWPWSVQQGQGQKISQNWVQIYNTRRTLVLSLSDSTNKICIFRTYKNKSETRQTVQRIEAHPPSIEAETRCRIVEPTCYDLGFRGFGSQRNWRWKTQKRIETCYWPPIC